MRILPILIFAFILIIILMYSLYRGTCKEKSNLNLLGAIEDYYSSMMPPQSNTPQEFVWFTGLNLPVFNSVTHFYHTIDIGDHIDAIIAKAPLNKPISFWIHSLQDSDQLISELGKRGFKKIVSIPFMSWNVTAIEQSVYTIKPTNNETIDVFHSIIATANKLDHDTKIGYQQLLAHSPAQNYLLYIDNKPVAAGTLFVTGTIGCLFNIAVLPEYQKKGYGAAISQFLLHRAHELNLDKVILNASPIAIKMYEKLGFVKQYDLDIYA